MTAAAPLIDGSADISLSNGARVLIPRLPALVAAYLPGAPLSVRQREQLLLAAAEGAGAAGMARLHRAWSTFVGADVDDVTVPELRDLARACAAAADIPIVGSPEAAIIDRLGTEGRKAVEAAVALGVLAGRIERAAERFVTPRLGLAAFTPRSISARVVDACTVVAAAPVAMPLTGLALALEFTNRLVGMLPEVQIEGDPDDLFLQLVAAAVPGQVSSTLGRILVAHLPVALAFGLVDGNHAATVRLGRGALVISAGVAADVVAVLDGELGSVVEGAGAVLLHEVRASLR